MIVEPDFLSHWKTRMLIDLLNDPCAPMCVISLWSHAQNRKIDRFEGLSNAALKAIAGFSGDASLLKKSLIESGFLEVDGEALIIHGFRERNAKLFSNWNNGKSGGRGSKNGEPTDNRTETQTEPTDDSSDSPTETQAKPKGKPNRTHNKPTVNPLGTDKIRVDKSREEKIRLEKNSSPDGEGFPPARAGSAEPETRELPFVEERNALARSSRSSHSADPLPKNAAEVETYFRGEIAFGRLLLPPDKVADAAVKFFNTSDGNGWLLSNGLPIQRWKPIASNYAMRYVEIEGRFPSKGGRDENLLDNYKKLD